MPRARTSSTTRTCLPSPGSASPTRCSRASPPLPTTASPAHPRPRLPSSGCGRSSTSRSSRRTRRSRRSSSRRSATGSPSRRSCGSGSRRTLRTRAHSPSTSGACRSASRSAPISPSRRARTTGSSGATGPGKGSRRCSCRRPANAPWRRSSRCSGRTSSAPTASRSTSRRSPSWPRAACRSPTAPARTPCSAAASRRWQSCAPQASRWGSARTHPPRRPRSTFSRRCGRRSTPPGPVSGAPRRSSRPRRWRLATAEAARALRMDGEVGTLTPGKRADLTVVSLAGSPYHPVEDPAAAVVFGGSPERVLATIVDGQTRYRSEDEDTWREVRSTASAVRRKMLGPHQ